MNSLTRFRSQLLSRIDPEVLRRPKPEVSPELIQIDLAGDDSAAPQLFCFNLHNGEEVTRMYVSGKAFQLHL